MFKRGFQEKSAINFKSIANSVESIIKNLKGDKGKTVLKEIKNLGKAPVPVASGAFRAAETFVPNIPAQEAVKKWIDIKVNGKNLGLGEIAARAVKYPFKDVTKKSLGQAAKNIAMAPLKSFKSLGEWTFRDVTPKTLGLAAKDIALAPFKAVGGAYRGAKAVYNFPQNVRNKLNSRRLGKMRDELAAKGFSASEISNMISLKELSKMGAEKVPSKPKVSDNMRSTEVVSANPERYFKNHPATKPPRGGVLKLTDDEKRDPMNNREPSEVRHEKNIKKYHEGKDPIFNTIGRLETKDLAKRYGTGVPEMTQDQLDEKWRDDLRKNWSHYENISKKQRKSDWDEATKQHNDFIGSLKEEGARRYKKMKMKKEGAATCPLGNKPGEGPGRKLRDKQIAEGKFVPGSQPGKSKREQVLALLKQKAMQKKGAAISDYAELKTQLNRPLAAKSKLPLTAKDLARRGATGGEWDAIRKYLLKIVAKKK